MTPERRSGTDRRAHDPTKSLRDNLRGLLLFCTFVIVASASVTFVIWYTGRERDLLRDQADRTFAASINTSVCTFRQFFEESLKRSRDAVADPEASAGTKQRNREAIAVYRALLASQLTIPREFNCKEFLAGIVREQRKRERK